MCNQEIFIFFNDIYDETSNDVLKYVSIKCNKIDDIPDILQEIYLEVYNTIVKKGRNYFKNSKSLIFHIAKRKLGKYYLIKKNKQKMVSLYSNNSDDQEFELFEIDSSEPQIFDIVMNKDTIENIWKILNKKGQTVTKIFYLYYYLDLTITEISKELKLSESNVKNKIYRTLEHIKSELKGDDNNE
ncbi:MAG: sigma-70 family RNA polymerase sigma factor [Ignavibacteriales bacterium]